MAPAAIVVPGEVLLDRYPGAPYRVCHPPVQLQAATYDQMRERLEASTGPQQQ